MITVEKGKDAKEYQGWPVWDKEQSVFDYTYNQQEQFFVVEGQATVTPLDGDPVEFGAGDFVTMPSGLVCTWEIKEKIVKHYKFG